MLYTVILTAFFKGRVQHWCTELLSSTICFNVRQHENGILYLVRYEN